MDTISTERILADSFLKVLSVKPYDKITIGDIVSKCHASRATFYNHFNDKQDLVCWVFKEEVASRFSDEDEVLEYDELGERVCVAMRDACRVLGTAAAYRGQNSIREFMDAFFLTISERGMKQALNVEELSKEDKDFLLFNVMGGLALLYSWMESDRVLPYEALNDVYKRTARGYIDVTFARAVPSKEVVELLEHIYQQERHCI